ncbi:MAG: glycerol-3-phosphate acyltransferase, partial [Eubacteriales bacterium]
MGGIMFSELLPKIFLKKDIRELREDKNPGASNVFINCGVFMGSLCLLLDMAKGFLPVFVGIHFLDVNDPLFAAVMVSPVIGHAISPYHRFRGGKCIATAGGVLIAMLPVTYIGLVLPAAYILFSIVFKIPSH